MDPVKRVSFKLFLFSTTDPLHDNALKFSVLLDMAIILGAFYKNRLTGNCGNQVIRASSSSSANIERCVNFEASLRSFVKVSVIGASWRLYYKIVSRLMKFRGSLINRFNNNRTNQTRKNKPDFILPVFFSNFYKKICECLIRLKKSQVLILAAEILRFNTSFLYIIFILYIKIK